MQMGNECSSPHVASLEERPLVDEGEIPLVSFIIMHSLSMCPCKTNCLLSEFIILPAIFLYFISTPGDCLWEAFLRRRACGNRIRDLYAWQQGIRKQDKTSIYISGIHESAGRSVSVEKWTLPFSWSSNAIGWKLQWPNPVPVYFVFVIFGWRCLTKVKFENIHGKKNKYQISASPSWKHGMALVHFHMQTLLLLFLFSWVAYEKPGFEGHQYLLEEGAYRDWTDWGGYDEEVQSLRPIVGVSSKKT